MQFAYLGNRNAIQKIRPAHAPASVLPGNLQQDVVLFAHFISLPHRLTVSEPLYPLITISLSDRKRRVKLGKHISNPLIISTGTPQGCVPFPLLYCRHTKDCTSRRSSVRHLRRCDDATVIGRILARDE